MSKATETKLGELHGLVSDVLCSQLSQEEDVVEYDKDGVMMKTGERVKSASPATIAAAIKFLKDNNITSDIDKDENLTKLSDVLAKKQTQSRLQNGRETARLQAVN